MAASHDRSQTMRPSTCESPALVSPSTDLAAQTGAMLIDNPSMRFNSPCQRFQSGGGNPQDLAPSRLLSRQHSSTQAYPSRAPSRSAADPRHFSAASAVGPSHMQLLRNSSAQTLPSRGDEDQEWCADVANILPESMSEDLLRLRTSPVPAFQTEPVPLPDGSMHGVGSLPMLPMASGGYLPAAGYGWDTSRSGPALTARAHSAHGAVVALSSAPAALMMQRQHGQHLHSQSSGQPLASGGSAMEQLALSTAATADLLAGMAANSSQAHPHSASDLILAASATLQAFARAAQTTQGSFSGQQGLGRSSIAANQSIPGFGHLPEHQRQQLAFMQQQWQLQQQQQHGWFGTNGA